jgi:hypothetical protein
MDIIDSINSITISNNLIIIIKIPNGNRTLFVIAYRYQVVLMQRYTLNLVIVIMKYFYYIEVLSIYNEYFIID